MQGGLAGARRLVRNVEERPELVDVVVGVLEGDLKT